MICTSCGTTILPVVAIDIDGTLTDYHQDFAEFAWRYWNMRPQTTPWQGSGEFEDYIGISKEHYRETKLAYRQGGGKRTQPIQAGAQWFMQKLEELPVEVWMTTTRPWMLHDSTDPDTRWWLASHGIKYDHLLYDQDKYQRLASVVGAGRVIFVLDDLREMLDEAYFAAIDGGGLHQIVRQHNNHDKWFEARRVGNFTSALEAVERQISNWEYANANEH